MYIEALTEHFYPMVFLKKVDLLERPLDMTELQFPKVIEYDMSFGVDPFSMLSKKSFFFSFSSESSTEWAYITLAVYEQNWGLTDKRKSEYQIRVDTNKYKTPTVGAARDGGAMEFLQ